MESASVVIPPVEFKWLLTQAFNANGAQSFDLSCDFLPGERETLRLPLDTRNISLEEFFDRFLAAEENLGKIQIWRKDRRERGYYRYKIAVQGNDGNWYYSFEITEDVGDASHTRTGPSLLFRSHGSSQAARLFCYGTLLPQQTRAHILENSRCSGPAIFQGARLLDLQSFPGIRLGDHGLVVGELYDIEDDLLDGLDQIEGYDPHHEEGSLFCRNMVTVQLLRDASILKSYVYIYARPSQAKEIVHGDYRRHLLEKDNQPCWVVAYGSNLDPDRIKERLGRMPEAKTGFLNHYELIFNKKGNHEAVYANVRFALGANTPAVAYRLNPEEGRILDGYEGVDTKHYLRIAMVFTDHHNQRSLMQGYVAHPKKLVSPDLPTNDYLHHLRQGYRHWGLDESKLSKEGKA